MSLTEHYRKLAENPDLSHLNNEQLMTEYNDTALMLATDSGMPSNALRIRLARAAITLYCAEMLQRMTKPQCESCQHWSKFTPETDGHWLRDEDLMASWGACKMAESLLNSGERPANPFSTAFCQDDHCGLTTRSSHGCVQWAKK